MDFSNVSAPKGVPSIGCLVHFDLEAYSRHNSVQFFNITTSKSAPSIQKVCFVHFDFETRFAPQRRELFQRPNFQTRPVEVLCTFRLRHGLCATSACICSSLISPLASLFFDPPKPQNIEKVWRLCYLFTHLHLLSSDSFPSLIFFSSAFLFSDSSHLCFSSVHIVGSLTSKLSAGTCVLCPLRQHICTPSTISWGQQVNDELDPRRSYYESIQPIPGPVFTPKVVYHTLSCQVQAHLNCEEHSINDVQAHENI